MIVLLGGCLVRDVIWRRRLPHWLPKDSIVFVTWRLAGTLPLARSALVNDPDPGRTFLIADRELDRLRSGPQWLGIAEIADLFVDALQHGEVIRRDYELLAWAVMPNHIHLVMRPVTELPEIMRWLKAATAGRANRVLGRAGQPFWQREYYDHWVRSGAELRSVIR